ncbi:MAG TPA: glycoside hydrolase family 15 protein [Acidimicrobiales bacterium]|nr:glycoside hydrolase family 15 protein [Acidimicrobiales bacterium]
MTLPIEDYAVIGDLRTAAIVGINGSIDWLCLPDFDSASCFARILGDESHGFWQLAPASGTIATRRRYREDSFVLETEFDTPTGTVRVTDLMPIRETHPRIIRLVEGVSGAVSMHMNLTVRFDYGNEIPWVTSTDGLTRMAAGPDAVALWHTVDPVGEDMHTVADFRVSEGQSYAFTLVWYPSHEDPPPPLDASYAVRLTDDFWRDWAARCTYEGPWREAVVRSLITLKALTYAPTGGIVAAATTSLPEALGGSRNWDYRYCWLRDATFTLESLMRGGYFDEAMAWRDWLLRAVAGDVSRLQIMYGPAGERRLDEWEASWLPGYEKSAPVRIGNAASGQFQLDVYGEVMSALYSSVHAEGVHNRAVWNLQLALMEYVESRWAEPDEGIWEVRGPRRHFTYSKVMAWVAVDRAIKTLEEWPDLEGPIDKWRTLRQEIFDEVCAKGYNEDVGAFTQYYGSDQLDASVLRIPLVGFLPASDPRVVSTVDAVRASLLDGGLVLRYRTQTHDGDPSAAVDGLTGREGAFLACSFWLVDCLHLIGRTEDAEDLFARLLALRNELGLLSEEYDTVAGRLVGNFPQAFSHVSLVNSACRLSGVVERAVTSAATPTGRIVDYANSLFPPVARTPSTKRRRPARPPDAPSH